MPAVKQQRIIELQPNRIMNILHVDDKPEVLKAVKEVLEDRDYSVVSVESPTEAIKAITLDKRKFQVVIADILFEQSVNAITGSEFIAKSEPFLKDTVKIAFTGYRERILKEHRHLFDGGIILKGRGEDELYDKVDELYNQKVEEIKQEIYEMPGKDDDTNYLSEKYIKRQQELLIKELEAVDGNEVLVVSGDRSFTAKDLIKEIKNNTEIGKYHVELLLDYLDSKREEKVNGKR